MRRRRGRRGGRKGKLQDESCRTLSPNLRRDMSSLLPQADQSSMVGYKVTEDYTRL